MLLIIYYNSYFRKEKVIMEIPRQFDDFVTFFDVGIEMINQEQFRTLYCVMSETVKKRNNITRLALQYLLDKEKLTQKEKNIAITILDDSYYQKSNRYEHCKLCSDDFNREILAKYSNRFKFWELCFPTVPYFPANMMIYLKNRQLCHKENLQDLTIEELEELKCIISDLKEILNNNVFNGELTGINVLFNQISKSQLCIHGHIELMIKNIDKLNYGCTLLKSRNYDPVVEKLNNKMKRKIGVIPTLEGIRINMNIVGDKIALDYINEYENNLLDIIRLGNELRKGQQKVNNDFDMLLLNGLSPAPTDSIYLTDYRGELFLSAIPEIIPPTINVSEIGDLNDAENMYLIKYNATTPNSRYAIMKKYSPLVRPSSKVPYEMPYTENVKVLKRKVGDALNI